MAASGYEAVCQWQGKGDWSELREGERQKTEFQEENLLESAYNFRLQQRFTFQIVRTRAYNQDNVGVAFGPAKNPDLNPLNICKET